jgi:hypothetical protein
MGCLLLPQKEQKMIIGNAGSLRPLAAALGLLVVTHPQAFGTDTSNIADVSSGYNARDVVTSLPISGGFSVSGGLVHTWTDDMFGADGYQGYRTGNLATGQVTSISIPSGQYGNGFGDPFGAYDAGSGTFYAGYYSNSDAGVLRYSGGSWTNLGSFQSLYGADVRNGDLYVSGLNAIWTGGTDQDNQIALFDLSGGNQHDVLIQASGNSAHVAVDAFGNVYYANYNGTSPALYRWSFDDINSVRADMGGGDAGGGEGDLFLTYDDADLLSFLPQGANGIAVDEGGNVFVTVNGAGSSLLVMWNETMGTGSSINVETIATLDSSQFFGWFGPIDTVGDFLNGGSVYFSNYGSQGLAEITAVPEPSAAMLALGGLAALWARARKRRES